MGIISLVAVSTYTNVRGVSLTGLQCQQAALSNSQSELTVRKAAAEPMYTKIGFFAFFSNGRVAW